MADEANNTRSGGFTEAVEDLKGRAKEAMGAVTDNQRVEREGEAQQDKAEAQRTAAAHEAEAQRAENTAEANEQQQRANQ